MEKNLFLGVYKLRKKFRYLIKKYPSKNEVVRDLLAYVEERFNGFDIVKNKQKRKKRRRVSVEWHCLPTSEKKMRSSLIVISQIPFIRHTEQQSVGVK